uniref:Uncharacterized protein n=1 Tax=Opuntia streptacantha TaxID=393608 RepID=A0A7C9AZ25_OPUST
MGVNLRQFRGVNNQDGTTDESNCFNAKENDRRRGTYRAKLNIRWKQAKMAIKGDEEGRQETRTRNRLQRHNGRSSCCWIRRESHWLMKVLPCKICPNMTST